MRIELKDSNICLGGSQTNHESKMDTLQTMSPKTIVRPSRLPRLAGCLSRTLKVSKQNPAIATSVKKFVTLLEELGNKLLPDLFLQVLQLLFEKNWYGSITTVPKVNPYRISLEADVIGQTSITCKMF
jgi:hypothetical protein